MTERELRALVSEQLQRYAEGRRELVRLVQTLTYIECESLEDTIMALNCPGRNGEERVLSGSVSDPTTCVALAYRDVNRRSNLEARRELQGRILALQVWLDPLKLCVESLEGRTRRVLELLYFEEKTWEQTAEEEGISRDGVRYQRNKGICEIARMPTYFRLLFTSS